MAPNDPHARVRSNEEHSMDTDTDTALDQVLRLIRVDMAPRHRQPKALAVVVAALAAVVGSLAADAVLVALGTAVFPSTKGFVHFQFSDYARLTIVGVVVACAAWPVVTRVSSAPRWLYFRMAVVVTLVLLLPDVWILLQGEPAEAVAVLMVMHLAIAVVTYNSMVWIARTRELEVVPT
jgi:hypothetical protein